MSASKSISFCATFMFKLPVFINREPVISAVPVYGNALPPPGAQEADIAKLEVVEKLAVPNNEPVILPDTSNDPVI